jgi:hypothetical protein
MQNSSAIIEIPSPQPRDQAQVGESASNSPPDISTEVAVESRSSSFRNFVLPFATTLSFTALGFSIVNIVVAVVYPEPSSSIRLSNETLARAREYNHERLENTNNLYRNAMIPIVAVGFGALAIQQGVSYLQRNGMIGPRRRMIEEVSAEFVYPVQNETRNSSLETRATQPNVAPNLLADRATGEAQNSSASQLVDGTSYSV